MPSRPNLSVVSQAQQDLEEASRFLRLLGAKECTFQTFDDNAERKDTSLARIMHGLFEGHIADLKDLNDRGAGVFVTMNRTDLRGRTKENIKHVRAVSLDLDGAPLEPVHQCSLPPDIIVESSPGRFHVYWRVKKLPLEDFEGVQRAIAARFDGDPSVAKLTHVARVPGFFHCKGAPFLTRILEWNDAIQRS